MEAFTKSQTETYFIKGTSDHGPITLYVTNYKPGQGKLVLECDEDAWAYTWMVMGGATLQEFVASAGLDYMASKLARDISEIHYAKLNRKLKEEGYDITVENEFDLLYEEEIMEECFGINYLNELPMCHTQEYRNLHSLLGITKEVFRQELHNKETS